MLKAKECPFCGSEQTPIPSKRFFPTHTEEVLLYGANHIEDCPLYNSLEYNVELKEWNMRVDVGSNSKTTIEVT